MNPNRWREFQKRYFEELLFGAHDIEHNNAVALADYLATN